MASGSNGEFSSDYQKYCNWTSTEEFITESVKRLSNEVFSFPIFDLPFCNSLVQAVEPLVDKQELEEIPLGQFNNAQPLLDWISSQISQLASKIFPPDKISCHLKPNYFCVVSKSSKSVQTLPRVDNCDLVLNITLPSNCEGGELYYQDCTTGSLTTVPPQPMGTAVMHLGSLPHGSCEVISGNSFTLIMWFKRADRFVHFLELPPHVEKRVLEFLSPMELLKFGACSKRCHALLSVAEYLWASFALPEIPGDGAKKGTEACNSSFEKYKCTYLLAMDKKYEMNNRIWQELLATERTYVNALRILCDDYLKPIYEENSVLGMTYYLLVRILEQNSVLLTDMEAHDRSRLCTAFMTFLNRISVYVQYVTRYEEFVSNCNSFTKKLQKLQTQKTIPYDIYSYLAMPVSRIPRYTLIVQEMHKTAPTEFQLAKCQLQYLKDQLHSICAVMNNDRIKYENDKNNNNNNNSNKHPIWRRIFSKR